MNKLFPLLFLMAGCSSSLIEEMSRIIDDPVVAEPEVISFTDELVIELSWDEDPGADEYLIYKSVDSVNQYSLIYRGTDLIYSDRNVANEKRYLYSLVKMRGNVDFGPSSPVLGVGSMTVEDVYEPNDDESEASPFLHNLSANVQYYTSEDRLQILDDRDWYSIEVRPQMQAIFKVLVEGVPSNSETGLMFYLQPHVPSKILNQGELVIRNTSMEKKSFTFCIYPHGATIITGSSGGGKFIHYDLNFIAEQMIQ